MALEKKVDFTNRFYGNKEEFPSKEDCPRCSHLMPQLAAYTGHTCSWINGDCRYIPESSKYIYADKNAILNNIST